ncbi:MAG: helix-turn-helix transcriptional regulator [Leptospirillum sp.]
MEEETKRLYRVPEAARRLNIQPGTMRRWIFDKKIAVVRVGTRAVRIPASEIERIISEGTAAVAR